MEIETGAARQEESPLLIAEDDDEDFLLTREALQQNRFPAPVVRVRDGDELLDYLLKRGRWGRPKSAACPRLVLLDLNMPRRDGREALREIKQNSRLKRIPVVVLTTSAAPEDVALVYDLCGNAFVKKPLEFERFAVILRAIQEFWFESVECAAPEAVER